MESTGSRWHLISLLVLKGFIYHNFFKAMMSLPVVCRREGKETLMENKIMDCDIAMETVMKLQKELEDIEKSGFVNYVSDVVTTGVMEEEQSGENILAAGIMREDKNLIKCIAMVVDWAFINKEHIDDRIVKATPSKVRTPLYLGWPDRIQVLDIAKKYYTK